MVIRRLSLIVSLGVAVGCAPEPAAEAPAFDAVARTAVEAAVDSATRAFRAAEAARDTERMLAHLAPDFSMLLDGARVGYDSVAAGARRTMPGMIHFDPEWTDIRVRALGPDAAVSSFLFRDSVVLAGGQVAMGRGPTTLVWERRGADWLIVHADADHYPVP